MPGALTVATARADTRLQRLPYKERNLVERFFNNLKNFRAIATRYDKRADNYRAGVKLTSSRIWMRHNEAVA